MARATAGLDLNITNRAYPLDLCILAVSYGGENLPGPIQTPGCLYPHLRHDTEGILGIWGSLLYLRPKMCLEGKARAEVLLPATRD